MTSSVSTNLNEMGEFYERQTPTKLTSENRYK